MSCAYTESESAGASGTPYRVNLLEAFLAEKGSPRNDDSLAQLPPVDGKRHIELLTVLLSLNSLYDAARHVLPKIHSLSLDEVISAAEYIYENRKEYDYIPVGIVDQALAVTLFCHLQKSGPFYVHQILQWMNEVDENGVTFPVLKNIVVGSYGRQRLQEGRRFRQELSEEHFAVCFETPRRTGDRGRSSSELLDRLAEHMNSSLGRSMLDTLRSEEVQNALYMLAIVQSPQVSTDEEHHGVGLEMPPYEDRSDTPTECSTSGADHDGTASFSSDSKGSRVSEKCETFLAAQCIRSRPSDYDSDTVDKPVSDFDKQASELVHERALDLDSPSALPRRTSAKRSWPSPSPVVPSRKKFHQG